MWKNVNNVFGKLHKKTNVFHLTINKSKPIMPQDKRKGPEKLIVCPKKELFMRKKENRKYLTVTVSLVMAIAIIVSSVLTVAAAVVQRDTQEETETNAIGGIIPNGAQIVSRDENGWLDIDSAKPFDVYINQNGSTEKIKIAGGTVADALAKAKIHLDETKAVIPMVTTTLTENMTITIQDGAKVSITADGNTKRVIAPITTVSDAIVQLGYKLSEDDILSVAKNATIKEGMDIVIQRVAFETVTKVEEISYDKVLEYTDTLDPGEQEVQVKGVNGEKELTVKEMYIDGKYAKSEVIKENVIKEPVEEIIFEGVEPNIPSDFNLSSSGNGTFVDAYGNTVGYSQVLTGSGTAYTSAPGALTATGVPAYVGGVAVNPNIIPYGSQLYIETTDGFVYGYATAVDTGGALMDGSALVDLYYTSHGECINFGRRNVNIYVL